MFLHAQWQYHVKKRCFSYPRTRGRTSVGTQQLPHFHHHVGILRPKPEPIFCGLGLCYLNLDRDYIIKTPAASKSTDGVPFSPS
jgi:hypothetical protein